MKMFLLGSIYVYEKGFGWNFFFFFELEETINRF